MTSNSLLSINASLAKLVELITQEAMKGLKGYQLGLPDIPIIANTTPSSTSRESSIDDTSGKERVVKRKRNVYGSRHRRASNDNKEGVTTVAQFVSAIKLEKGEACNVEICQETKKIVLTPSKITKTDGEVETVAKSRHYRYKRVFNVTNNVAGTVRTIQADSVFQSKLANSNVFPGLGEMTLNTLSSCVPGPAYSMEIRKDDKDGMDGDGEELIDIEKL